MKDDIITNDSDNKLYYIPEGSVLSKKTTELLAKLANECKFEEVLNDGKINFHLPNKLK